MKVHFMKLVWKKMFFEGCHIRNSKGCVGQVFSNNPIADIEQAV